MNATVRTIALPSASEPIAVDLRNLEDVAEAFSKIRQMLGLSNGHCDELAGFTIGHTDKLLGPTHAKNLGPLTFAGFCWMFAVKFQMVVDVDQAAVMAEYWADRQRDASNVRLESNRVSQKIIDRAKPHVIKGFAKSGNANFRSKLASELRKKFAAKGGRARMRKVTKAERSAMNRKGWATRKRGKALVVPATSPD
jgi:multidrug efflux pump subunit AcrB